MRIDETKLKDKQLEKMLENGEAWQCAGNGYYYDSEDDGEDISGQWYSSEYLENSDEWTRCLDCDEWILKDDYETYYVESENGYICDYCYNNDYFTCSDCNEVVNNDRAVYTHDGDTICEWCYNNNYFTCECCEEVFRDYDVREDDYGNMLCEYCYEDKYGEDHRIYEYHDFDDWQCFKGLKDSKLEDTKQLFYVGWEDEIQITRRENLHQILDILEEAWPVVFMKDGSIGKNGVEVISHPFTYNYWLENKHKLEAAFNRIRKLGAISHDTNCCGLHFHFTRPEKPEAVEKMWLVLETYKNEIIKLSRREASELNHWAPFLSYNNENNLQAKTFDYIKDRIGDDLGNHDRRYKALNNTNYKTIEFRFFRGTLNFDTFAASYEFLMNLYKACISNIDLCKITWQKLATGKYIEKYIKENNINSNAIVKDESLTIEKHLKKMNRLKKQAFTELQKQLDILLNNIPNENKYRMQFFHFATEASETLTYMENDLNLKNWSTDLYYLSNIRNYLKNMQGIINQNELVDFTKLNEIENKLQKMEVQ